MIQNGKIVLLPKAGAFLVDQKLIRYNAEDETFINTHFFTTPPKKFMIMKVSNAQRTVARLIARSGIIPAKKMNQDPIKYYVDLPVLNKADEDVQMEKIKRVQRLFRDALSRRRRSLLFASCMAFQSRLGKDSILSQMDGSGSLMHRLIAPFILKDA